MVNLKSQEFCENCRFCTWALQEGLHWCRKNPPTGEYVERAAFSAVSPCQEVDRRGWCGSWEKKEEEGRGECWECRFCTWGQEDGLHRCHLPSTKMNSAIAWGPVDRHGRCEAWEEREKEGPGKGKDNRKKDERWICSCGHKNSRIVPICEQCDEWRSNSEEMESETEDVNKTPLSSGGSWDDGDQWRDQWRGDYNAKKYNEDLRDENEYRIARDYREENLESTWECNCGQKNCLSFTTCWDCGQQRNFNATRKIYEIQKTYLSTSCGPVVISTWQCKCGARNDMEYMKCHFCSAETSGNCVERWEKEERPFFICKCGKKNHFWLGKEWADFFRCSSCGRYIDIISYRKEAEKAYLYSIKHVKNCYYTCECGKGNYYSSSDKLYPYMVCSCGITTDVSKLYERA